MQELGTQLDLDLGAFQDADLFWDTDAFAYDALVPAQFLDTDVSLCDLFSQYPSERHQEGQSLSLSQDLESDTQPRPTGGGSSSQEENPYPPLPPQFPTISDRLQENDLDARVDIAENPWTISTDSYRKILERMIHLKTIIPDFTPLSRCALARYLEGYFKGFHGHLPFLHSVTFRPEDTEIELVLSLAAVGALYRFEHRQGYALYEAVSCLIDERTRSHRRDVIEQISRTKESGCLSGSDEAPDSHNSLNSHSTHLQRAQALIVLMAISMWGDERLLQDSFIMGSQLAQTARELGINQPDTMAVKWADLNWHDWTSHEQRRRTLLSAYIVLNLQSIAFDVPPMLLSQEVALGLPSCESTWKASSLASWETCRKACGYEYAFGTVLDRLLQGQRVCDEGMVSAFSNYVLIHGLLQNIYLQQKASPPLPLPPTDHARRPMEHALKAWQASWETTRESTLDPISPKGPLGFNATALLRLAHIRLNLRSTKCSSSTLLSITASTPTPRIQDIFANSDTLTRSASLDRAVLQCIHALSIPVRVGISYVAHIQTVHWSIQHSICNLECAFLLTRWMQMLAAVIRAEGVSALREDEKRLLRMVDVLVRDSNTSSSSSSSGPEVLQEGEGSVDRLAVLVMRLWAEVTSGQHVFDIVHRAGAAIARITDVLELQLQLQL